MASHHLPWSQSLTMTNPTSVICNSCHEHTAVPSALSRTFFAGMACNVSPLQRCEWRDIEGTIALSLVVSSVLLAPATGVLDEDLGGASLEAAYSHTGAASDSRCSGMSTRASSMTADLSPGISPRSFTTCWMRRQAGSRRGPPWMVTGKVATGGAEGKLTHLPSRN